MKVTDKEFWKLLAQNGGIYQKTARAIEKKTGESYSRQAVEDRAKKHLDKLNAIREANKDDAEDVLLGSFRSKNEKIRLQAAMFYLKTQCKNRGYTERVEQTGADGKDLNPSIQVEIIDRREQVDEATDD